MTVTKPYYLRTIRYVAETIFRSGIQKFSLGRSFLNNPPWNLRIAVLPLAFWTPKCHRTVLFTCDRTCRRDMVSHNVVWRPGARTTFAFRSLRRSPRPCETARRLRMPLSDFLGCLFNSTLTSKLKAEISWNLGGGPGWAPAGRPSTGSPRRCPALPGPLGTRRSAEIRSPGPPALSF